MANIKEVAKLAGVSTATVSRALSGKVFVEEATRERVLAAVKRLGYSPNPLARGLKAGCSRTLAIVVPDLANPFFPKLVQCAERRALEMGYSLVLCDCGGDPTLESRHVESLKNGHVDGVLYIAASNGREHVGALLDSGVPVVAVNRDYGLDVVCVTNDNHAGAFAMVEHLILRGHRRIACLAAPLSAQHFRERHKGCLDAFARHGLNPERHIVGDVVGVEGAFAAAKRLLGGKGRPTAFFVFTDMMAFGVYSAVAEGGLTIPGDVSVAGFDDIIFSRYLTPSLTTYHHPAEAIAARAVTELVASAVHDGPAEHRRIEMRGHLVERASVRTLD